MEKWRCLLRSIEGFLLCVLLVVAFEVVVILLELCCCVYCWLLHLKLL